MTEGTPIRTSAQKLLIEKVRANLIDIINNCDQLRKGPENVVSPSETTKLRKDRLRAHYHQQPHPFYSDNESIRCDTFVCEIDDGRPSIRKQFEDFAARRNSSSRILKDMKLLIDQFSNTFPPYKYPDFRIPSSEPFKLFKMSAGLYVHFGIERNLRCPDDATVVLLDVAVYIQKVALDGIVKPQYLTIFGRQDGRKSFVIGIYKGNFPIEFIGNEILQPFVAEMVYLQSNGMSFIDRWITVQISSIVCDPIANSMITCTSLPTAMYGCSKCKLKGTLNLVSNITSFPTSCPATELRDDDDFVFCVTTEHHLAKPILSELGIGLISQVSIDYQHIVCLGIVKSLIELWLRGDLKFRLNRDSIRTINRVLGELAASSPAEIKNNFKLIEEYDNWTAYDFKQFVIYYGSIALRGNLEHNSYVNFLYLSLAMRILHESKHSSDITYYIAGQLLQSFVKDFGCIYGEYRVDYNVHNALHLEEVARRFRGLENVSGFTFTATEQIDSLISGNNVSLHGIAKIIGENNLKSDIDKTSIPEGLFQINDMLLSIEKPNNCLLTNKGIAEIQSIELDSNGLISIYCRLCQENIAFADFPVETPNIYQILQWGHVECISPEDIVCKAAVFRIGSYIYAVPLLVNKTQL